MTSTITAEERAKVVVRSLCEPLDSHPYIETPLRLVMSEVIAAAIREAEAGVLDDAINMTGDGPVAPTADAHAVKRSIVNVLDAMRRHLKSPSPPKDQGHE